MNDTVNEPINDPINTKNEINRTANVHPSAYLEAPVKIYTKVDIAAKNNIGKYTYIRPYTYTGPNVKIGRFCSIGDFCIIGASHHPTDWVTTHTFAYDNTTKFPQSPLYNKLQPLKYKAGVNETILGADVWIGSKVVIMQGVKVGHGSIIGAGAIITKDVPAYSIVVGANRIVGLRFKEYENQRDIICCLRETKWWELSDDVIAGMAQFDDLNHCMVYLYNERKKLDASIPI